jgi:hypothetical protein
MYEVVVRVTLTFFKREREAYLEFTWSAGLMSRDALLPIRILSELRCIQALNEYLSVCLSKSHS